MDNLWAFLLLAVILSLTPGPDDVLVLSSALRGGPRLGAATAFGAATGALVWGGAAAVGLAAVVSRSTTAYDVIRLAGAGYLVVLGMVPLAAQLLGRARVPTAAIGTVPAIRPAGLRPTFARHLAAPPGRRPLVGALLLGLSHRPRRVRGARPLTSPPCRAEWRTDLRVTHRRAG